MEKKKASDKAKSVKKAVAKSSEPKTKKAAAAKSGAKRGKPGKTGELKKMGVQRASVEARAVQEKGSIAPPSSSLIDAFSALRARKTQRPQAQAVTRLPAPAAARPHPAPAAPAKAPAVPEVPKLAAKPGQPFPASAPAQRPGVPAPAVKAAAPAAPPAVKVPAPSSAPSIVVKPAVSKPAPAVQKPATPAAQPLGPAARPKAAAPAPAAPAKKAEPARSAAPQKAPAAGPEPAAQPLSQASAPAPALKPLKVTTQVTVRELAEKMAVKVNDLIKKMMTLGVFATINQRLESDTAILIAHEYGFDLEVAPMPMEEELGLKPLISDAPENLKSRSSVVTIMGHVDHGKTSLLDAIREAKVAEGEAGGITQHIGAYQVNTPKGVITFLDTPGHEAFTAMRARGAKVTDIVVLVVSAADGVMPQTVEAIDHAKAAGVPIVVAVNKIDLPTAQPQKIRQELTPHGLLSEEWGGKNIFVDVSAKKRLNLEKLLEMLLLQAEMMELKANPERPGVGVILEARLDPRRGNVATLLVQNGSVKVGQPFVVGLSWGKLKALINDKGGHLQAAGPSTPVEILGISGDVPQAGDVFNIVSSEKQAREIAEKRRLIQREETLAHKKHLSLISLKAQGAKELRIILKADVQGSVQAIKDSLEKLSTPEIAVNVIHAGAGNATESDVLLASASDAVILLFHSDLESRAREIADRDGVETRNYEIIYDLLADVKAAMEGLLEPEIVDTVIGRAEVRKIFNVRGSAVAGCFVREGKLARSASVRVVRGGQVLAETKMESLKRFQEDASEVEKGLECGVALAGFKQFAAGDVLEAVVKEKRVRRLEPAK